MLLNLCLKANLHELLKSDQKKKQHQISRYSRNREILTEVTSLLPSAQLILCRDVLDYAMNATVEQD